MARLTIIVKGKKFTLSAKKGELLADALLAAGFFVERPCAGRGSCGKCRVLVKGALSKLEEPEQSQLTGEDLKKGFRLACQARILGDATVTLPEEAVVTDKIFSGQLPVDKLSGPFGIAFDLGTTTVAAFLVTLRDNIIHRGHAVLNQQSVFGAEVISRMEAAFHGRSAELQKLARSSLEQAAMGLGLSEKQLQELNCALVVGNSVMHHLFLGLPVNSLLKLPFQPTDKKPRIERLKILGREIELRLPPLLGGFVGSDTLACLLYLGFAGKQKPVAAVDLGTNGEVMVSNGSQIAVASTAAGPAFEGVNIECGMRAGPGAVSAVRRGKGGKLDYEVIGGGSPRGLSGSGLLSLVNLLRREGMINASGKLAGGRFEITDRIFLSQADVREVQKAKAAVRAAFEVLLEQLALKPADLDELLLTGSFGARIDINDALELGLVPGVKKSRVRVMANSAGMGAGMMLADEAFAFAATLAQSVRHIELYADRGFMDKFIAHMKL
jgi:uncharacterized 2Fe-2S/4Fe-4S cluster protein (DUF4445 family)